MRSPRNLLETNFKALILLGLAASIISTPLAYSASFDCNKARAPIEHTICGDAQLSELDSKMSESYKRALSTPTLDQDRVKSTQKLWIKDERGSCKDVICIRKAYTERIHDLDIAVQNATSVVSINAIKPTETKPVQPTAAEKLSIPENNSVTATPSPIKTEVINTTPPKTVAAAQKETVSPPEIEPTKKVVEEKKPTPSGENISFASIATSILTIIFLVGMVKPKLVARWKENPTRKYVAAWTWAGIISIAILANITGDPIAKVKPSAAAQSQPNQEQPTRSVATQSTNLPGALSAIPPIADALIDDNRRVCSGLGYDMRRLLDANISTQNKAAGISNDLKAAKRAGCI